MKRAPWYVALAIGALGAGEILSFGMRVHRMQTSAHTMTSVAPSSRVSHGIDTLRTVAGHLFGEPPAVEATGTRPSDAGGAFLLAGIIATADPKVGSAIIGRQGQATRLFQAGGLLAGLGNGRLYEVYADRVILDLNGRFQTLLLPRPAPGVGGQVMVAENEAGDAEQDQQDQQEEQNSPIQPVSLAQSTFANLNPVLNSVRGHFGGVRLSPSADDKKKFGLRDGDVVVAVNGVKLADMSSADTVLKGQDDDHPAISLTVLRNGDQQIIQVTNAD